MARQRTTLAAVALALGVATIGRAQEIRPGDVRPELPAPGREAAPRVELPPFPEPEGESRSAAGLRLRVERFEITGSTVFSADELARAVAPFTGRELGTEDLLAARDAVTRLYVDAGYVTSGAVLLDQDPVGGVVKLEVVEGALADVEVDGNRQFRDGFFASRLLRAGRAPLRLEHLEAALRQLQRYPLIERVDAVLEPARVRGESRLVLTVSEASRFHLGLEGNNDRSPAVGSWGGAGDAALFNLAGWGDSVSGRGELSEGVGDYEVRGDAPITPWDTRAALRFRQTRVELVEAPFDELDIVSHARTWGVELEHPLYRDDQDELWVGAIGELRKLETQVIGLDFCFEPAADFSNPLPSCSGPHATVLRANAAWTRRSASDVVALRSLLSFGVDAFGATVHGDRDLADGRFVAWLAQGQWAHVLPETLWGSHLVVRADLQLANDPLLSFERFAIGGRTTVRGYRENQLVTDSGVIASAELRVPIWRDGLGRHRLELVPFMDFGHGWDEGPDPENDRLWSAGAGLRAQILDGLFAEAWWGGQIEKVEDPNRVLQDHGVHLRVRADVP